MDDALELMFFGWRGMTRPADELLATFGMSRVHHRILYAIARAEMMTLTDLIGLLAVSKQALHRPMKFLFDEGYVVAERAPDRHRFKILSLTSKGKAVEHKASELERRVMRRAFAAAGPSGRKLWAAVMREAAKGQ